MKISGIASALRGLPGGRRSGPAKSASKESLQRGPPPSPPASPIASLVAAPQGAPPLSWTSGPGRAEGDPRGPPGWGFVWAPFRRCLSPSPLPLGCPPRPPPVLGVRWCGVWPRRWGAWGPRFAGVWGGGGLWVPFLGTGPPPRSPVPPGLPPSMGGGSWFLSPGRGSPRPSWRTLPPLSRPPLGVLEVGGLSLGVLSFFNRPFQHPSVSSPGGGAWGGPKSRAVSVNWATTGNRPMAQDLSRR